MTERPLRLKYVSESGHSGYGRAGRGYLRALAGCGAEITWTPMVVGRGWGLYLQPFEGTLVDDEFAALTNRPLDYDTVLVHLIPQYWRPWRERESGRKIIGVTVLEADRLPSTFVGALQHLDGVIVPCRWNERVLREAGFAGPVHVAPHVPSEDGDAAPLDLPGVRSDDFVFYSIGDWKDRKGMHLTVESFCRAFRRSDPVVLLVKTGEIDERRRRPGFWWWHFGRRIETPTREIRAILRAHPDPPRVVALTREFSDAEIRSLHARGDAYVSLTRAEGWGLGAYEAAFAGKPVIITGHGGQLDYLPSALSTHVPYRLVPARPAGELDAGFEGLAWAEPDLDQGARLMRETFDRPAEARARGEGLAAFVRGSFDAQRIAKGVLDFAASL